jgi:hypothetical protein
MQTAQIVQSKEVLGIFTGKQIIEAVKNVAGPGFRKVAEGKGFNIGQSSQVYYANVIVVVDEQNVVEADKTYSKIVVQEFLWKSSPVSTMLYRQASVVKSLNNFAESLEAELNRPTD